MAQITTTDANEFSSSLNSPLCAALAIVIYKLCCRVVSSSGEIHPVLAAAGVARRHFVDLAWSEDPAQARHKPRLWCFTGWKAVSIALTPTVWLSGAKARLAGRGDAFSRMQR